MQVGSLAAGLEVGVEDKIALTILDDNASGSRGRLFRFDKGSDRSDRNGSFSCEHRGAGAGVATARGRGLKGLTSGGGGGREGGCGRRTEGAARSGGLEGLG